MPEAVWTPKSAAVPKQLKVTLVTSAVPAAMVLRSFLVPRTLAPSPVLALFPQTVEGEISGCSANRPEGSMARPGNRAMNNAVLAKSWTKGEVRMESQRRTVATWHDASKKTVGAGIFLVSTELNRYLGTRTGVDDTGL